MALLRRLGAEGAEVSYQRCDRCHKRKDKDAFREHAGQCRSCDKDERVEYEAAEERARRHAEWTETLIAAWRAVPADERNGAPRAGHVDVRPKQCCA